MATHIEQLAAKFSDEPNVLLLRGHIHVGLGQLDLAREDYKKVIILSDLQDLIDCAKNALIQIEEI